MTDCYFRIRRRAGHEWIVPTDLARGPWTPDACHGGPPTGMLVRALERALPSQRLARISVELSTPVPMTGFRIDTAVLREGRATSLTSATLLDEDGAARASAIGMHVRPADPPVLEGTLDNSKESFPRLADTAPGPFVRGTPFTMRWPGFRDSVECRYPVDVPDSDPTTVLMRTAPLLADEEMSPFQRISPLADCGNAFSKHVGVTGVQFINTDLVVALHRDPVGEWMGSRSASFWHPNGRGLADAVLFDDQGPVGRALQTLLLRPGPTPMLAADGGADR